MQKLKGMTAGKELICCCVLPRGSVCSAVAVSVFCRPTFVVSSEGFSLCGRKHTHSNAHCFNSSWGWVACPSIFNASNAFQCCTGLFVKKKQHKRGSRTNGWNVLGNIQCGRIVGKGKSLPFHWEFLPFFDHISWNSQSKIKFLVSFDSPWVALSNDIGCHWYSKIWPSYGHYSNFGHGSRLFSHNLVKS